MSDRFSASPTSALGLSRNVVIAGCVVLFHAVALWALQSGLLRRAAGVVVPIDVLSEFIEPPKPVEPPPPAPPPEPKRQVNKSPPPTPRPQAIREPRPTPAPNAPTGSVEPPPPPAPITAPAPPAAPPATPAPPSLELPSSNADYLQNPKPVYPVISKRLGEQGKTVVRVLIGVDGLPNQASIRTSSGYERLDEAARAAVMSWRYVPGKRNGVAEPMEFNVPINWVLN